VSTNSQNEIFNRDLSATSLLVLCGHCVYDKGLMYTEYQTDRSVNDRSVYVEQLSKSIKALQDGLFDMLILSGGYTKKQIEKSEAQGMLEWAQDLDMITDTKRIILEEFARDSFENILFSMCKFYESYNRFPGSITFCSWTPKERRFRVTADSLKISTYSFWGIGENKELECAEEKLLEIIITDPFYRRHELAAKRQFRDPWNKGIPYSNNKIFGDMFETLSFMEKTEATDSSIVKLPWVRTID